MADIDRPAAGVFEQVGRLFATIDNPRRPGYIGLVPYLLILRWFTLFGIVLRFLMHESEYRGRTAPLIAASLMAFAAAALLSTRRFREELSSAPWKALVLALLDTAVISMAYLATQRLQSDSYLFFFLPLITAAEYLPTAWVAGVFLAVTAAFWAVICTVHFVDRTDMNLGEAFLRVYLGREFFLFGLICTAWYLFQQERHQQRLLARARRALDRAGNEAQGLFTFSARSDQLFLSEDLVREAVTLATGTTEAAWGLGVLFEEDGRHWQFHYPPGETGAAPDVAAVQEMIGAAKQGLPPPKREGWAVEWLDIGDRKLGLVAVGVRPGETLRDSVPAFLKAFCGPLLNGLRRNLLVASLRKINRATLRAFDFDCELNDTLREVTEELHMEFGTITLKDDYRGVAETVRGRNVPPGLLRRSRYRMDAPDIQTHVIDSGRTRVLDRNCKLFNQEIFEFFEHQKLARVWVAIRDGDHKVIGTIEAGCAKQRRREVLTKSNCRALERLAARKGPMLGNLRPQALLSLIAQEAIGLIGADWASVHVFQASEVLPHERLHSIGQEDFAAHFHCEDPVLAAGAGRSGQEFIRKYAPRPGGIGWKAILAAWRGDPDGCQSVDSDRLKMVNPGIYAEGVRAILAIPLRVRSDLAGVLYVHHWNRHQFTNQEIQIERVFAAQIEVAIQIYFLLRNIAVTVHDSQSLLDWLNVMQSPAKLGDSAAVMEELAQGLLLVADASNVVLYQYEKERSEFLRPILKGKFLDRAAMTTEIGKDHLAYQLLSEQLPHFYNEIGSERNAVVEVDSAGSRRRFVDREQIRSCAMLELRARPGDELFGLLFVNYRKPQRFTREQKNTMQVLGASAATVIRTARFYEWLKKRRQHIESLRQIDAAIVASAKERNLDAILSSILKEAMLITGGWAGAVFMRDAENQLVTRVAFPGDQRLTHLIGAGAVGRCTDTKKPEPLSISESDEPTIRAGSKSCLAVPLLDGGTARGVLYVEGEQEGAFADEDARILETLAIQAVIALHTIESYRELDLERSRAEALSLVAKHIQNSKYPLDLHLYIILTGITAGESLGFSRAMLFERVEGRDVLRGRSAVGEISLPRAKDAWEGIGSRSVEQAIETAIKHFQSGAPDDNRLMQTVRGMEIPLTDSNGAIAECVLSRSNQYRYVNQGEADRLRDLLETEYAVPFACIPLVGRQENLGALVVDNRFQPGEREPLSPEMIGRVAAYAELAAMTIEAARLSEKTQTQSYEDLAHQLRTPMFMAGSYCQELVDGSAQDSPPAFRSLKACIDSAIHISERLQDYTELAKGKPLPFKPARVEPSALLREAQESARNFEILCKRTRNLGVLADGFSVLGDFTIASDLRLMREALECLLENAVKYSFPNTEIEIGVTPTENPLGFELYVQSEGLSIKAEDIHRLAERGFRGPSASWVAAHGSGIGLWVVDGIMRTLGGKLLASPTTADNRTRIRLWFPGSRE